MGLEWDLGSTSCIWRQKQMFRFDISLMFHQYIFPDISYWVESDKTEQLGAEVWIITKMSLRMIFHISEWIQGTAKQACQVRGVFYSF